MPEIVPTPLANIALATAAAGSLLVSTGPGAVPSTPAGLHWDGVNKRLAVGTTAPAARQHLVVDAGSTVGHIVQGLSLYATITQIQADSANVITATTAAPHGFSPGMFVSVSGLSSNAAFNSPGFVNAVTSNTFTYGTSYAGGAFGPVADTGLAVVNQQAANLASYRAAPGLDLLTVGPGGGLAINNQRGDSTPCLDMTRRDVDATINGTFIRMRQPQEPGDTWSTYFDDTGALWTKSFAIISGHYQGSGGTFGLMQPSANPMMVGIWGDVGLLLQFRDSGGAHDQIFNVIQSQTGLFTHGLYPNGQLNWALTASMDANGVPLFDTDLGRSAAGQLRTTGQLRVAGTLFGEGQVVAGSDSTGTENGTIESFSDGVRDIFVGYDTARVPRIIVDPAGKLGVGAAPSARLHVYSSNNLSLQLEDSTAAGYTQLIWNGTGRKFQMGVGNAGETALGVANKLYIFDATAGAVRFTLDPAGNAQLGRNSANATATPLNVSYGGDFGTSTPGSSANQKWTMFHDGATNTYGIGMSAGLMEYQAGAAGSHQFFVNQGTLAFTISSGGAIYGTMDTMAYAAAITLDTTLGNLHKVTATGDATINASTAGAASQTIKVLIVNDATSGRTITFGANFRSTGPLVGATSKAAMVTFDSDGTAWFESARTTNL